MCDVWRVMSNLQEQLATNNDQLHTELKTRQKENQQRQRHQQQYHSFDSRKQLVAKYTPPSQRHRKFSPERIEFDGGCGEVFYKVIDVVGGGGDYVDDVRLCR